MNNTNALLFTHIPSSIVKVWEPDTTVASNHKTGCALRRVELKIDYNNLSDFTRISDPQHAQGTNLAHTWKSSLKLWEDLEYSTVATLAKYPETYCGQSSHELPSGLLTRITMTPNESVLTAVEHGGRSQRGREKKKLEHRGSGKKN